MLNLLPKPWGREKVVWVEESVVAVVMRQDKATHVPQHRTVVGGFQSHSSIRFAVLLSSAFRNDGSLLFKNRPVEGFLFFLSMVLYSVICVGSVVPCFIIVTRPTLRLGLQTLCSQHFHVLCVWLVYLMSAVRLALPIRHCRIPVWSSELKTALPVARPATVEKKIEEADCWLSMCRTPP
jgi:hypothetical protein